MDKNYRVLATNYREYWEIEEYFYTFEEALEYYERLEREYSELLIEKVDRDGNGYITSGDTIRERIIE